MEPLRLASFEWKLRRRDVFKSWFYTLINGAGVQGIFLELLDRIQEEVIGDGRPLINTLQSRLHFTFLSLLKGILFERNQGACSRKQEICTHNTFLHARTPIYDQLASCAIHSHYRESLSFSRTVGMQNIHPVKVFAASYSITKFKQNVPKH